MLIDPQHAAATARPTLRCSPSWLSPPRCCLPRLPERAPASAGLAQPHRTSPALSTAGACCAIRCRLRGADGGRGEFHSHLREKGLICETGPHWFWTMSVPRAPRPPRRGAARSQRHRTPRSSGACPGRSHRTRHRPRRGRRRRLRFPGRRARRQHRSDLHVVGGLGRPRPWRDDQQVLCLGDRRGSPRRCSPDGR